MGRRSQRSRAAVLVASVASASIVAAGAALLVVGEARVNSIPGLAIAVFGTFLTSMAIIAAFSIEEKSRWPTPWEALDRAHVPIWFVVALASVVTALLAGALDSSFLSAFSLALALVAVPLGTLGLWGLISLSSDQGRWRLVVDLLARSILEPGPGERRPAPDLGEIETEDHVSASFLTAGMPRLPQRTGVSIELVPGILREYADRRDLEAIVGLVDEVHAGACQAFRDSALVEFKAYLNSVDTLLLVQRQVFAELANRVLSGQLGDATARIALVRAGEAALDSAGRARRAEASPDPAIEPARAQAVEVLVARHLTALCRLAGAAAEDAEAQLRRLPPQPAGVRGGVEVTRATALQVACVDLQQAVRWAVDPDPPGMKIPADHVWQEGLSDPESALVWLWSAAESASGPFGVGLYAVCEALTGKKFFDSYWDGFDVFTEMERRLYGGGEIASPAAAGREAIERAGGLPRLSLELAAARLAATPARAAEGPTFDGDPARRDDRHAACNLFLAGGGYKPSGRDPIADLAWLLSDRLRGSLWTTVYDQLAELPDAVLRPPLRPLHHHPQACALAICLRLARLRDGLEDRGQEALQEFAARLPEPLLERTAALALRLTAGAGAALADDPAARQGQLIEAARFAGGITPGPLPTQYGGQVTTPPPPPVREPPPAPELADFDLAISRLAAASSEQEVDLIQCDRRWLDEWAAMREELDVALLATALNGTARVRRIVRYDLPQDADRRSTRLHYRWVEALSTAVSCFQRGDAAPAGRPQYEVRLLVVPGAAGESAAPVDCLAIRGAGGALTGGRSEQFEALWNRLDRYSQAPDALGLIELGGPGGRGPAEPR